MANPSFFDNPLICGPIQVTLEQFSFTGSRIAMLNQSLDDHTSALVGHIHDYILQSSGLQPLLHALDGWDRNVCIELFIPPFL